MLQQKISAQFFDNLDPLFLKRIGYGVAGGIVLLLLLSIFDSGTTQSLRDLASKVINLAPAETQQELSEGDLRYPLFSKNRRPLTEAQQTAIKNDQPRLSIIVMNVGLSNSMTDNISTQLPPDVTLALSSFTNRYNETARALKAKGFELWIDIATQTIELNADVGETALSPANNFENNIRRLSEQLDGKELITGINLPAQSLMTEALEIWQQITNDLYAQGYGIIDNTSKQVPPTLYYNGDFRAPYIKSDLALDTNIALETFEKRLNDLKNRIESENNLILSVDIHTPAALRRLSSWINALKESGITLVPLSAQAIL